MIIPSTAPPGNITKIVSQIPLLGEIAKQIWTTPLMDVTPLPALIPVLPIPLPGECEVYVNGGTNIHRGQSLDTFGEALTPTYTYASSITLVVNIRTQNDAAAWALLMPTLNVRKGSRPKSRIFLHPHTALLGIDKVFIESWNVDHYTPVKGGVITMNLIEDTELEPMEDELFA